MVNDKLEFFDLAKRKKFTTSKYSTMTKTVTGKNGKRKIKLAVVEKSPLSGNKVTRIISNKKA